LSLYEQRTFQELVILERKRSERSKKPFLIVFIDIRKAKECHASLKAIKRALFSSTRDIDIKGWWQDNQVLGLILPEAGKASAPIVMEKISGSLQQLLEPSIFEDIGFSSAAFPEDIVSPSTDKIAIAKQVDFYPLPATNVTRRRTALGIKRLVDIIIAASAIALLAGVFLLISVLVRATSKGPVLFRQERIGFKGKPFTMYKFRSMYVNRDASPHKEFIKNYIAGTNDTDGGVYKITNDPRVTPVGRLLRKLSLDELPQLFNVFKGDMSLVGPRPPIAYEVEMYDIWHLKRIHEMRPGITGLWQTMGRSTTSFENMVRMDIQYIENWSLWLDFKLLLLTPWYVLTARGAY
jgi:lipopolysaccharide/colanic/teichoic acid biosynthesis glycosyltransferase